VSVGEEVVAEERIVQEGLKDDREEAGLAEVEDSSDALLLLETRDGG